MTLEGRISVGPVSELLAKAASREVVTPSDGKSSSSFERVVVDGERFFLKRLSRDTDWIMRATGDHVHRPNVVWRTGIMDQAPACIDHTVVAMEVAGAGDSAVLSMLMRDVAEYLVPEGDSVISVQQHAGFIDHLAELSAAFWGYEDDPGSPTGGLLSTMPERLRFFERQCVARELAVPEPPGAIVAADLGWQRLPDRSPSLAELAFAVHEDPALLTGPMATTPATLLHGDWKMGNLGTHSDGRTILLDWAYPGPGPACWDLCWYLALNRSRLPETKEDTIARFRGALEGQVIDTSAWFEAQLDLCVVGMMVTFGWEKALGDEDELRWWERRVAEAVVRQDLGLPHALP